PSSSAASWTLHDVRDPQSADPVRTTSATVAISSWFAAGCEAPGLRQVRIDAAAARSTRSSATRPSRASAFGLELSRTATRSSVEARSPPGQTLDGNRRSAGRAHEIHTSLLTTQRRVSDIGEQERGDIVQHVRQRRERRGGAFTEHSEHHADEEDEQDARNLVLHVDRGEKKRGEGDAEPRLQGPPEDRLLPDPGGHRHQRRAHPRRDVREREREAALASVYLGKQPRFGVIEHTGRDHEGGRDDSRPGHLTPRDVHEAEAL